MGDVCYEILTPLFGTLLRVNVCLYEERRNRPDAGKGESCLTNKIQSNNQSMKTCEYFIG